MINDEGLIKKSAVLKLLRNLKKNRPYANLDTTLDVAAVNVRKMPTADVVEVVHGEWIEHKYAEESEGLLISNYECNQCHSWKREESNYCPNCGAKMRNGDKLSPTDGKKVE